MKNLVCFTRLYKRLFLSVLLCTFYFIVPITLIVAQNSTLDEESQDWIIAASAFESDIENDKAAELIPIYVLENILIPSVRTVTPAEQYRRVKKSVLLELLELYQALQTKTLERDSLVLTKPFGKELTDSLEPVDNEIAEILRQIAEKKEEENSLAEADFLPIKEEIILWNNDASKLYTVADNTSAQGPNDISALLTGSIQYMDSFIHVKASLTLYPGVVIAEEVSETDSILAIEELSARLADKLYASIVNAQMVSLDFTINPPEAAANTVIHINGNILSPHANTTSEPVTASEENIEGNRPFATTVLPGGIYELYIESPGYNAVSTVYDFSVDNEFTVQVNFEELSGTFVKITLPTALGSVYINAIEAQQDASSDASEAEVAAVKTEGSIFINNLPALGEFVSEDGVTTWFFLDDTQGFDVDSVEFSFVPDTTDLSERIEKNRERMYNSYAALIVSLPFSFIAQGQYTNEFNSFVNGSSSGEKVDAWNIARYATIGTSIGVGINFLIQLGLYIHSVNAVLPEELEPLNK